MQRRQLLAGLVTVTGTALPARPAVAASLADPHLQALLTGPGRVVGQPASVPAQRAQLASARGEFGRRARVHPR